MTIAALPRGDAAGIVRDGLLAAFPWLRYPVRADLPVPAELPLATVQRLIAGLLGWDALDDLRGFSVDRGAVIAEVYARDQEGRRFLVGDEIAVDRIHIPVV